MPVYFCLEANASLDYRRNPLEQVVISHVCFLYRSGKENVNGMIVIGEVRKKIGQIKWFASS